jgi:hypothetical protein
VWSSVARSGSAAESVAAPGAADATLSWGSPY